MPRNPNRFSKANLVQWLERLVPPKLVAGAARLEQDAELGHMNRGMAAAQDAIRAEVRAQSGQISRAGWEALLADHLQKAREQARTPILNAHNGWSQCVGSPPERWFWYGYFRQTLDLGEDAEYYFPSRK